MAKNTRNLSLPLSKYWQMMALILPAVALLTALGINLAQNILTLPALDAAFWAVCGLWAAASVIAVVHLFRKGLGHKGRLLQILPLSLTVAAVFGVMLGCAFGYGGPLHMIPATDLVQFLLYALSLAAALSISATVVSLVFIQKQSPNPVEMVTSALAIAADGLREPGVAKEVKRLCGTDNAETVQKALTTGEGA